MDVTKRLQELDPTLILHNEGDWQNPLDSNKPGYTSFNDAGVETETGDFLYAFARLLKPKFILETGTHIGVSAAYMGQALKENKQGMLETIEFIPQIHAQAQRRIETLGLEMYVRTLLGDVAAFDPGEHTYKLILLDTEPQTRFAELVKFYEYLEPGGFVFIHDLHRHMYQLPVLENNVDHPGQPFWPYGKLPDAIHSLVNYGKLKPFHFDTPRGLTGFYKPHPEDYKFNK